MIDWFYSHYSSLVAQFVLFVWVKTNQKQIFNWLLIYNHTDQLITVCVTWMLTQFDVIRQNLPEMCCMFSSVVTDADVLEQSAAFSCSLSLKSLSLELDWSSQRGRGLIYTSKGVWSEQMGVGGRWEYDLMLRSSCKLTSSVCRSQVYFYNIFHMTGMNSMCFQTKSI